MKLLTLILKQTELISELNDELKKWEFIMEQLSMQKV